MNLNLIIEIMLMNIVVCCKQMFSCQLDKENLTALSIIDPVTINVEVRNLKQVDLCSGEFEKDFSLLDR